MKLTQINYDTKAPTEIEILDPTTNKSFEKPAFISIYSMESKIGKNAQIGIYRDILAEKETNKDKELSEDFVTETTVKHLASIIAGWRGIEDDKGKEIKYSKAQAIKLLSEYDLIFNLVNTSSATMGNYLKK